MYLVICYFTTRRLLISHPDYASKVMILPVWGQVQRVFHQNRISTLYYREGLSRNLGLADFSPKWKPCIVFERHHREDFSDESCAGKLVVELLSQYFIFDLSLKSINNVINNFLLHFRRQIVYIYIGSIWLMNLCVDLSIIKLYRRLQD